MKLGSGDLIIEVDSFLWDYVYTSEDKRIACLDHELCHVNLKLDKEDEIILTADCRPALKMIHHDKEIGIFYDIVRRHQRASLDFCMVNDTLGVMTDILADMKLASNDK
jgi:hypothetical protein